MKHLPPFDNIIIHMKKISQLVSVDFEPVLTWYSGTLFYSTGRIAAPRSHHPLCRVVDMTIRSPFVRIFVLVFSFLLLPAASGAGEPDPGMQAAQNLRKTEWEVEIGKGMTARPAVLDKRALALSTDGWAVLVDCENGGIIWRERVGHSFISGPVTFGSIAYVASQGSKRYLAAVSLMSGATLWRTDIGMLRAGPVRTETGLVLLESNGTVECFDTARPLLLWSTVLNVPCAGTIYSDDESIFAACGDTVYAIESGGGRIEQKFSFEELASFHPLTGGGVLAVSRNGRTALLDPETGAITWSTAIEAASEYHISVSHDTAVVSSGSRLSCLETGTGQILWMDNLPSPVAGPPDMEAGWLAVTTIHGGLYFIDQSSGDQVDSCEWKQPVSSPPVMCDDRILISTQLGKLMCLSPVTGRTGGRP
jgi:outer membrane protein assembly factor BamB